MANVSLPTADITGEITLIDRLEKMTKEEMVSFAAKDMGLNVDPSLDVQTIKEKLLIVEAGQRNNARNRNVKSLKMVMALVAKRNASGKPKLKTIDPPVQVKFYNIQSPGADFEFTSTEPYGFKGEVNGYGFTTSPYFHLFHGEIYILPMSTIEHLQSLTYTAGKAIIDPVSGMQAGSIPTIKKRFSLEIQLSKGQYAALANMTETSLPNGKEQKNGADDK